MSEDLGCIACEVDIYDYGELTIGSWVRITPSIKCSKEKIVTQRDLKWILGPEWYLQLQKLKNKVKVVITQSNGCSTKHEVSWLLFIYFILF